MCAISFKNITYGAEAQELFEKFTATIIFPLDMKWKTEIPDSAFHKHHSSVRDHVMFIGSCFSDNVGGHLSDIGLPVLCNPLGVMFNPISVCQTLQRIIRGKLVSEGDLFAHQSMWHHPDFHSSVSRPDKNQALSEMNDTLQESRKFIKTTKHIFISLGTAYVFESKTTNAVVANCHKLPAHKFNRKLLGIDEITGCLQQIISQLRSEINDIVVHFTVSPIRHVRDGMIENQRSKAHLISSVHEVVDNKSAFYFPSYEIMMDELRDYRYYSDDLTHLSTSAINYIREKFITSFYDSESQKLYRELVQLNKDLHHRPLHPDSDSHKAFQKKLIEKVDSFRQKHPFLQLDDITH